MPGDWPRYILYLFISSYFINSWATTDINTINYAVTAINFVTTILISYVIGAQIAKLTPGQIRPQLLGSIGSAYLLLQLTHYPTHSIIDSFSWIRWLVPQGSGQFAAAALITLSTLLLLKLPHWWNRVIVTAFIAGVCVAALHLHLFSVIYLSLGTASGYFIYSREDATFCASTTLDMSNKPWFYISLVLTPLAANLPTTFFSNLNPGVKYLLCFLACSCILFVAASKLGIAIFSWFTGWIAWISGNQEAGDRISQRSIESSDFSDKHYPRWVTFTLVSTLHVVTLLVIGLISVELPVREWSFRLVYNWVTNSGLFVAITCASLFILYSILRILLSRLAASLFLLIVIVLLSSANALKIRYLGVPLAPSDFHLIDQAFDSLIFIAGKTLAIIIYLSIFSLLILFAFITRRHAKKLLNTNHWIGLRGVAAFFLFFFVLLQPEKLALGKRLPNVWELGSGVGLYTHAGFAAGFLYRYQQFYIRSPENFSSESTLEMASSLNLHSVNSPANQNQPPHIIAIQSEAFWDSGNLHQNLYPQGSPGNLARVCESLAQTNSYCQTGHVEVPVFGGSTANSEFEFLTGLSMHLLPEHTTPFVHYIQKPTPSLAWRAQQANYQTLAIHPNGGWFWNRDRVYPLLGIEEFLDIDAFAGLPSNPFYVADHSINRLIYKRIEEAQQPQFIFAVSMANHAPFTDQRYASLKSEPIDWEKLPALTDNEQQAIKTYSIGVRESRMALEELIETYNQPSAPPVIIVFYGDHLPILGENYSIYNKSEFKTESVYQLHQEFYATPYLVWSNQPLARPLAKSMTVSLLGQEVFELAGLGRSGLQQLVSQLQDTSLLRRPTRAQIMNNERRTPLNESQKALATLYRHAVFDALFHQTALTFFGLQQPLDTEQLAFLHE